MLCHNCHAEIPDSALLCDVCGAVVKTAPADEEAKADKRHRRINLRRLIAICAAAAVLVVGIVGILVNNSPEAVAKRYVKAYMEGDIKEVLSLSAGDMQKLLETETGDTDREQLFQTTQDTAEQLGLDVSVENFNQCYKALRKIVGATYSETFGDGYKVTVEVRETEDMSIKEFDAICAGYENDTYRTYVDIDKLAVGKYVTVTVTVSGKEGNNSFDRTVPLVKYKGAWKAVVNPYTLF